MKNLFLCAIPLLLAIVGCETTPSASSPESARYINDTSKQVEAALQQSDIASLSIAERKKIWKTMAGNWIGSGNKEILMGSRVILSASSSIAITLRITGSAVQLEHYVETNKRNDLTTNITWIFAYSPEEKGTIRNIYLYTTTLNKQESSGTFSLQNSTFNSDFTKLIFTGYKKYTEAHGGNSYAEQLAITLMLSGDVASGYKLVTHPHNGSQLDFVALNKSN